jgi:FMN-dependent NADH-azoreductase
LKLNENKDLPMKNILLLNSSPRGDASHSGKVAAELVAQIKARAKGATLTTRDLATDVLPHIDDAFITGRTLEAEKRTRSQNEAVALSDKLIAELNAADTVVITSPMINFGLATTLKAWFDYVLRAGVTFKYSEKGPEGLVTGKKVFVAVARGGVYSQGPMKAMDFQEPYLRQLLGFIGMTDVTFIPVEGVGFGPDAAAKAEKAAIDSIPQLLAA